MTPGAESAHTKLGRLEASFGNKPVNDFIDAVFAEVDDTTLWSLVDAVGRKYTPSEVSS